MFKVVMRKERTEWIIEIGIEESLERGGGRLRNLGWGEKSGRRLEFIG